MSVRRIVPPVLVAVAAATLLTACPGPVPDPTPTGAGSPTASGSPTPTPTPTTGGLAPEVAFVVTGTLTAPGGATTVDFRMTVDAPTQADAAADAAAFASSDHCPPDILTVTPPTISNPAYVHITIEASTAGAPYAGEAGVSFGSPGFATTWDGAYLTAQAFCAPPYLAPIPGVATAIGLVEHGVVSGPGGWIPSTGGYGVGIAVSGTGTAYAVTSCDIELGPASAGTAIAGFVPVDAGWGCSYGLNDTP